jgi:hypothetical protein
MRRNVSIVESWADWTCGLGDALDELLSLARSLPTFAVRSTRSQCHPDAVTVERRLPVPERVGRVPNGSYASLRLRAA